MVLIIAVVAIGARVIAEGAHRDVHNNHPGISLAGLFVTLFLVATIGLRRSAPTWVWFLYPFSPILTMDLTNFFRHDASAAAQAFGFFSVLYAGAQLRRVAAATVCAAAVVGNAVITFANMPFLQGADNVFLVAAVMVSMTALMVHNADHIDTLVARLTDLAAIDPLTGLVTRRVLDSAAASALQSAARDGGTAMLIVDVDHFKQVNDTYGHLVGDAALQQVAAALTSNSRRTDIVSRLGGDEMAVLMPGTTLPDAIRQAERLVALARSLRIDPAGESPIGGAQSGSGAIAITVSVGLAHLPTHADDVRALYRAADAALYKAKREGRNRLGFEGPRLTPAA